MQKLPQLTLRDLFWLVALVAMGCGWWVRERQLSQEVRALEEACWRIAMQQVTHVSSK